MSGIVGIFNQDGQTPSPSLLRRMLDARPERGPDGADCWSAAGIGLGRRHFWLTPEEWGERQPLLAGELALAADARLDNRPELGRSLGLDAAQLAATSDSGLILAAYRRWGTDGPGRLLGDYAFLLWDGGRGELFAARDPLGARGLSYTRTAGRAFVFASDVAHLLAHPDVQPALNESRVAAYLADALCPPEETFFDGIHHLAPGHALVVSAEGERLWKHWEIDPAHSVRYRDEQSYADHYLELLTEAVECRLRVLGPVAVSLSGGLDSTTIAALAAPVIATGDANGRLRSYSYAFDELVSCDERRYIAPVVERYGLDATYLPCDDKWTLKDIDNWPTTPDYVLSDSFAWLPDAVMTVAGGDDCRVLLGGYFGDTLMTGEHYWALDMMRGGRFGLLARTVADHRAAINWRAGFVEFGFRRLIPEDLRRLYRRRLKPRSIEKPWPGIHDDLISKTDLRDRLTPPLAPENMRVPGFWQRYQSLTHVAFSQGAAAVRYQYNRRGLELLLPYLDRRLVEFVMAVPAYVLGRPGDGRKLHRQAMAGRLPEEVRLRRDPTSFAPLLVKGVADKEVATIRRVMTDAEVVRRGYIRGDWLEKQLHTGYEPSAESRLLLKAIYLELWLRRHWSAAG